MASIYRIDGDRSREIKKRKLKRWGSLKQERQSWVPHWRECAELTMPRLGRFFIEKNNKGDEINDRILDNATTRAVRVLRSMLMAFGSSPARRWIKFGPADPDLAKDHDTAEWFDYATSAVLAAYDKSNTYEALHQLYGEDVVFGTGCNISLPHFDRVLHNYPLTCGQYALASDAESEVCTVYREFRMTADQMVREFGLDAVSTQVRRAYEKEPDAWFSVLHAIEPREDRNPSSLHVRDKAWSSCYIELGTENRQNGVLRESGFDFFPAQAPRWEKSAESVYGTSPVMDALPDTRQLQDKTKSSGQMLQFAARPCFAVPEHMLAHADKFIPGGLVPKHGDEKIEPLWMPDLAALQHVTASIQDDRERINSTLHVDLMLLFSSTRRSNTTIPEIEALDEEKMMLLGPVINQMNRELWQPLAINTFNSMLLRGAFPPLPEQMQGKEYGVETLSLFSQAQKAVTAKSTERMLTIAGALAQLNPDARDKIAVDNIIDQFSDQTGVPPSQIVATRDAAVIRKARNQAMQAKEQSQMMLEQAKVAQSLGNTPVGGAQPSALDALTGYGRGVA